MALQNKSYTVVGIGEILWDLFLQGKKLGGAPSNFVYHAHMQGADAYAVSRIGSDTLGIEIMERMAQLCLNRQYIQMDPVHPTGIVTVQLDSENKPKYTTHEDVAWDFISFGDDLLKLAANTDAVCFGSLCQRSESSRKTIMEFLKRTRKDCIRVFDVNLRQNYYNSEIIIASLQNATVLKLNDEELPVVSKLLSLYGNDNDILNAIMNSFSLDMIVLTRGAKGSLLITPHERSEHPGKSVDTVDSVGAGDAFTATVIMGLLKGYELGRINEAANLVGSYVCTRQGGTPDIPESLLKAVCV